MDEMHHHDGCPHDHESGVCPFPVVDAEVVESTTDAEVAETVADAAVEIAEIEAETERARIAADLEHHELSNESMADDNDTSLEHHQIEAERSDDLEEAVEELTDEVIDLEEIVEEVTEEEGGDGGGGDEDEEDESDVTEVAPAPRIEAPSSGAGKTMGSVRRGGNLRRGRR